MTVTLGAASTGVLLVAHRARSLSTSGAVTAGLVGAAMLAAGTGWAVLLLVYFVSSSVWSRVGRRTKGARTASVVAKGGARDGWQVAANGGVAACAALGALLSPDPRWGVAAAGALAASAADTWATEIGTWRGGTPRHVLSWQPLAPGMSGGVSLAGTVAMFVGAGAMAAIAQWAGVASPWWGITTAGVAGAVADSVAGATLQERRRCDACGAATEQRTHVCGGATRRVQGIAGFGNDAVNALATCTGAIVAVGATWSIP